MNGRGLDRLCGLLALVAVAAAAPAATWDGNGNSDNGGSWGIAANWENDNVPDTSGESAVLGDVTSGTREITVDASTTVGALTMTQSTGGATNKLTLNAQLVVYSTTGAVFNATAGSIVIDKKNQNFMVSRGGSATVTFGPNVTIYSTGGVIRQDWNGGALNLNLQGTTYLSGGLTELLHVNRSGDTVTHTGTMDLSSGGGFFLQNSGCLFVHQGTIAGDGTGVIGKVEEPTKLRVDAGSKISGLATIGTNQWDFRGTNPADFNFTGTTLMHGAKGNTDLEVATNSGANYQFAKLAFIATSVSRGSVVKLVDNHDNDPSSTDPEHLRVGAFDGTTGGDVQFEMNGLNLVIDNNCTAGWKPIDYGSPRSWLSNSTGSSTIRFLTPGGTMIAGHMDVGITGAASLEVIGPTDMKKLRLTLGDGTFRFDGDVAGSHASPSYEGSYIDAVSGTNLVDLFGHTWTTRVRVRAAAGADVTLNGQLVNAASNNSSYGLIAAGGGTVTVTSDYGSADQGGRVQLDSGGTFVLGGHFRPGSWWNGLYGDVPGRMWAVDTSASPSVLAFNGGAVGVQDFEVVSKDYAVSGDELVAQVGSGIARLPFGTVAVGHGGTPAHVRLVNLVNNTATTGSDTMNAARNLTIAAGSTFDLNGFRMTVALGQATVTGTLTDAAGGGLFELAEGADMAFGSGQVDLPGEFRAGAGSVIDLSTADLFRVGTLSLLGDAYMDFLGRDASLDGVLRLLGDQVLLLEGYLVSGAVRNTGGPDLKIEFTGDYTTLLADVQPPPPPPGGEIPEPASALLVLTGALGLAARRRRRA